MRSLIPWKWGTSESAPSETAVTEFKKEVDDLFSRFFGSEGWLPSGYFAKGFMPALDVSETDENVLVKAELPGVDPKEIEVNISGQTLTIKGEKKEDREEKTESLHRIERSYGSFYRAINLPCEVNEEKIEATFKDGVLNLKMPKTEPSKKRTIKIDVK
ncbi:MAG: Hsp20/alpha crystallin family protein [Desulfomonilaceae bacterium]